MREKAIMNKRIQTKTLKFRVKNDDDAEKVNDFVTRISGTVEKNHHDFIIRLRKRINLNRGMSSLKKLLNLSCIPRQRHGHDDDDNADDNNDDDDDDDDDDDGDGDDENNKDTTGVEGCLFVPVKEPFHKQDDLFAYILENKHQAGRKPLYITARDIRNTYSKQYEAFFCRKPHGSNVCNLDAFASYVIQKGNQNRYELLQRDGPRRHYMDVEWLESQLPDVNPLVLLKSLLQHWETFHGHMENMHPKTIQVLVSTRKTSNNCDTKHSYHLVWPHLYFQNVGEHLRYMRFFQSWLAEKSFENDEIDRLSFVDTSHKKKTTAMCKFIVDFAVYTKNRLIRMEGQSKSGSDVVLQVVKEHNVWGVPHITPLAIKRPKPARTPYVTHACLQKRPVEEGGAYIEKEKPAHPFSKTHTSFYPTVMNVNHVEMEEATANVNNTGHNDAYTNAALLCTRVVEQDSAHTNNQTLMNAIELEHPKEMLPYIDGAALRYHDMGQYWRMCGSLVKGRNPSIEKDYIIQWMNKKNRERAVNDYERALKMENEFMGNFSFAISFLKRAFRKVSPYFLAGQNTQDGERTNNAANGTNADVAWNALWTTKWTQTTTTRFVNEIQHAHVPRAWYSEVGTYVAIRGPMGSGKTHMILDTIKSAGYRRVLFVVGRMLLVDEIVKRAEYVCGAKVSVYSYKDPVFSMKIMESKTTEDEEEETDDESQRGMGEIRTSLFVTCINSCATLPVNIPFDMVVVDEAETTIQNLYSIKLMGDRGGEISAAFTRVCTMTPLLITIDAEHSDALANNMYTIYVKRQNGQEDTDVPRIVRLTLATDKEAIYKEAIVCTPRLWPFYKDPSAKKEASRTISFSILHRVLEMGEKVCVSVPYKYIAEQLRELLTTCRPDGKVPLVVLVTGSEPLPPGTLCSQIARGCDVMIYTSCISAGHSIDIGDHFDAMYTLFAFDMGGGAPSSCCSLTEQVQMTARLRRCRTRKLFYSLFTVRKKCTPKNESKPQSTASPSSEFDQHYKALRTNKETLQRGTPADVYAYVKKCLQRAYPGVSIKNMPCLSDDETVRTLDRCGMSTRKHYGKKRKADEEAYVEINESNTITEDNKTKLLREIRPTFKRHEKVRGAKFIAVHDPVLREVDQLEKVCLFPTVDGTHAMVGGRGETTTGNEENEPPKGEFEVYMVQFQRYYHRG